MIIDAVQSSHITAVVTIIATLIVVALFRFGHNLHAAIDKRDEDEAEDARLLARVAHSIDGMDESERAKLELWVG